MEPVDIIAMTRSFQRGEEEGFNFFFKYLYVQLHYFAFKILRDRVSAEEVLSESWIKIWERHATFTHHNVIKSWMYTTIKNACYNRLNSFNVRRARESDFFEKTKDDYDPPIEHKIIQAEVLGSIYQQIESLPTECRRIFKMLYIEGKTAREIAEELKLNISTVKNQKARGLALIKNKINPFV